MRSVVRTNGWWCGGAAGGAVLLSAVSCGSFAPVLGSSAFHSIDVNGRARTFRVQVPRTYDGSSPVAVVLVLHGGGGDAEQVARYTRFDAQAEEGGFIVVYPNGLGGRWNDGREPPDSPVGQIDDVSFFRALIEWLEEHYRVDPKRIYACGISNGAMMSYRLACELSDRIAAIGPVAGSLPANLAGSCPASPAVSVIAFFGTEDRYVPIDGGEVIGNRGVVLPLTEALTRFATTAGCATQPVSEELPDVDPNDRTTVRRDRYVPCVGPQAVEAYIIAGGGHTWPGARAVRFLRLGATTQDINANRLMWAFFEAHPKP